MVTPLQHGSYEYKIYYHKKNVHFWYKVAKDLSGKTEYIVRQNTNIAFFVHKNDV